MSPCPPHRAGGLRPTPLQDLHPELGGEGDCGSGHGEPAVLVGAWPPRELLEAGMTSEHRCLQSHLPFCWEGARAVQSPPLQTSYPACSRTLSLCPHLPALQGHRSYWVSISPLDLTVTRLPLKDAVSQNGVF